MARYQNEIDVPQPIGDGMRSLAGAIEGHVDRLGDLLGAIDARLFGERPAEVNGPKGDASVPPISRTLEGVAKQLVELTTAAESILDRL
jgi:hypothetical protein